MNAYEWITRLTAGRLVRQTLAVEARRRGSSDPWTPIPASAAPIVLDESSSPSASARIELGGPVPPGLLTPTAELWNVRIILGFEASDLAESEQVAYLVVTDVERANGRTTLVCASDEALLAKSAFPPGLAETACPQLPTLSGIWASIKTKLTVAATLTITDTVQLPAAQQSAVWAIPYGGSDRPLDYLRALADAADLWLHSDQSATSSGGLIIEPRPLASAADPVNLLSGGDKTLVIDQASATGLSGAYASAILLTCTWTTATGKAEASGLIPATGPALVPMVMPITLNMRPPTAYQKTITPAWAAAQTLANRQAQRTWETAITLPALPWLRPGMPALTDEGLGIIRSITFDPALATAVATIRPA